MIKSLFSAGGFYPVIICDNCGKRIQDGDSGIVINYFGKKPKTEGALCDLFYTHKGDCHNSILSRIQPEGTEAPKWIDLDMHLAQLNYYLKITQDKISELFEMIKSKKKRVVK